MYAYVCQLVIIIPTDAQRDFLKFIFYLSPMHITSQRLHFFYTRIICRKKLSENCHENCLRSFAARAARRTPYLLYACEIVSDRIENTKQVDDCARHNIPNNVLKR